MSESAKAEARPAKIPEGMQTVTPHLVCADAAAAIEFYKQAFGAVELSRMLNPEGKIIHASFRIGDSVIMLNDELPHEGLSVRSRSRDRRSRSNFMSRMQMRSSPRR